MSSVLAFAILAASVQLAVVVNAAAAPNCPGVFSKQGSPHAEASLAQIVEFSLSAGRLVTAETVKASVKSVTQMRRATIANADKANSRFIEKPQIVRVESETLDVFEIAIPSRLPLVKPGESRRRETIESWQDADGTTHQTSYEFRGSETLILREESLAGAARLSRTLTIRISENDPSSVKAELIQIEERRQKDANVAKLTATFERPVVLQIRVR